jgi:hypothetical protein
MLPLMIQIIALVLMPAESSESFSAHPTVATFLAVAWHQHKRCLPTEAFLSQLKAAF